MYICIYYTFQSILNIRHSIEKMKKNILFFFLIFFAISATSQEINFSDSTEISLLTCSPGPEVYAKFGHSGVRVKDKLTGTDVVFNWGLFSFNTENFYLKFIAGETDYLLGAHRTDDFLMEYKERNSVVWEQVINFTKDERKRFIALLLTNYQPENRLYRYNFVFDNCATRPRDMILGSVDGHVVFNSGLGSKTFRQAIEDYVTPFSWLGLGIDIVFGVQADRPMPQLESMFLPEVLKFEAMNASIYNKYEVARPLISENKTVITNTYNPENSSSFLSKPSHTFTVLLIIILLISIYEIALDKKYITIIDSVLLFTTGIGGIIITYLMLFSLHPLVKYNFNILWLNPLNFIAAFLIWFRRFRIQMFAYQLFNFTLLVIALIAVALSIQTFNQSAFIIIAILLIRYSVWIYRTKKKIVRRLKYEAEKK